jgi:hypothetical protein
MAITLRSVKGTALTYDEADENWDFLDRTKHDKLDVSYAGVYNNPRITVDGTGQIIAVEAAGNLTPGTYGTTARVPVITVDANGVITGISDAGISIGVGSAALLTIEGSNGLTGSTTVQLNQLADATATVSHADTSSQASLNNSNGVVIQDVTLDDYGHVTGLGTTNLDTRYQPLGSYDNYQNWEVQNSAGTSQFTVGSTNGVRFAASGDSSVSFNAATNTVTITTAAGSGGVIYATESYVDTAISNLVDSAPGTLDTLNELAASLNDDADFAGTMTTALGTKLNTNDFTTTANTWLATKSTDNVTEGTNLYYTTTRFDDRFGSKSTDNLAEGSLNLYYTDSRVATYLSNNSYATTSDISTAVGTRLDSASNLSDLGSVTTARANLGLGSLSLLSSVTAGQIDANAVGASELNVSGNGSSGQYLTSDGDGSFSWTTLSVQTPAITSNGSTPSLNTGITGAEVRSLIGAGTSSFNGAYGSLTGTPYEVSTVVIANSTTTYVTITAAADDTMIEIELNNVLPNDTASRLTADMSTNGGSSWITGSSGTSYWWAYQANNSNSFNYNSYAFMYAYSDHYRINGSSPWSGEPGLNGTLRWDLNNRHRFGNTTYGSRPLYYNVTGWSAATTAHFTKGAIGLRNYNQSNIPNAIRLYWASSTDTWYPGSKIIIKRYKS